MVLTNISQVIPGVGSRRSGDWIEGFIGFTSILPSPLILRQWAAISAVAAALERRVWTVINGLELYPNLYVILVAPAATGKGVAMVEVRKMIATFPKNEIFLAPNSLSKASLIDALADSKRSVIIQSNAFSFNSMYVVAPELGHLIPAWDNELINSLTDIYDGGPYEERKRSAKLHIQILRPQLNLLGATTPSYLTTVMPPGAWDQGFISRTILVYSSEKNLVDLFKTADRTASTDLEIDLRAIGKMQGKMTWTPQAAEAFKEWYTAGCPPAPDHARLASYNGRRHTHALKLCMVSCASRGEDMVINGADVVNSIRWLVDTEVSMPEIFLTQVSGGDSQAIEDADNYLWKEFAKTKLPVPEHKMVDFLKYKVNALQVMKVLELMCRTRKIELVGTKEGAAYKPLPRVPL